MSYRDNPYHIQAFFTCVIKSEKNEENKAILLELIDNLEKINTDVAKEMTLRCKAQMEAFYNNSREDAISLIDDAISMNPNIQYGIQGKRKRLYAPIAAKRKAVINKTKIIEENIYKNASAFYNYCEFRKDFYNKQRSFTEVEDTTDKTWTVVIFDANDNLKCQAAIRNAGFTGAIQFEQCEKN